MRNLFQKAIAVIVIHSPDGSGQSKLKTSGKGSPFYMPLRAFLIHGKRSNISINGNPEEADFKPHA